MATIDYSQPLVAAGASAQTDFAAAKARTGLNFQGTGRFKRGFKVETGLEAFADASAGLSKFVKASIEGTAFARAKAGLQLQLPLNLFDEFGFSARAEVIAEAAAGIKAALGVSIGDFIMLAKRDPAVIGLPFELLLLLLEEVDIGGEVRVNVSVSAKAHASISISGKVLPKPGEKPGFFFVIDAGVGLKAGVGKGLSIGAGFKDFRRFYGRAVDRVVDTAIVEVNSQLPADLSHLKPFIGCFAPIAKISLRTSYEIGKNIIEANLQNGAADAEKICNEAVKVVLEEVQRFTLDKLVELAFNTFQTTLEQEKTNLGNAAWNNAQQERNDLADLLLEFPEEAFQVSQENFDYWRGLIGKSIALINKLYAGSGVNQNPLFMECLSILYCCSELLLEATSSKLNNASAYAMAIAAGAVKADTAPFKGPLSSQPDGNIKRFINQKINPGGGNPDLSFPDLLQFLIDDVVLDRLIGSVSEVKEFLALFKNDLNAVEKDILKLFLQNAGAFIDNGTGSGDMDAKKSLQAIVNSTDGFLTNKFEAEVLPQILQHIEDPMLRLYVEEVLYGAAVYTKNLGLQSLLNWEGKQFSNDDFTEALAGVMMLLLGRTVVIMGDTLMAASQKEFQKICNDVAHKIETNDASTQEIRQLITDPDLKKLVTDGIRIGGEVLGPLPPETRTKVRRLLYQVFEPLPPNGQNSFLTELADQFFIPNFEQLEELTYELADIAKKRFGLFAEKFILAIGAYIFQQLLEVIEAAIQLVLQWEKDLKAAIQQLGLFLANLDEEMRKLNQEMIQLFQTAMEAIETFFNTLASPTLRSELKAEIKSEFTDKALNELEKNDLYKKLPGQFKSTVRSITRNAVDGLIDSPVINPVFNAINAIAAEAGSLLPEVKNMNPEENLPEQMMELVVTKMEEKVRAHFGSTKPKIDLGFSFTYRLPMVGVQSVYFSIGKIEVPLNILLDHARTAINNLNFYHDALNTACIELGKAFAKEIELALAREEFDKQTAEKARLDQIEKEHNQDDKQIMILSPTALCHYTNDVDIKIHLGGVSMSYLGMNKDESQRVLIYLNGALVPPKSLLVDELLGTNHSNIHKKDVDYTTLKGFDKDSDVIRNNKSTVYVNTPRQFGKQPAKSAKNGRSKGLFISELNSIDQPKRLNQKGKPDGEPVILSAVATDKNTGLNITDHQMIGIHPGRKLTVGKMEEIANELIPGVMLQFRADIDELNDGVNVLSVVVIERGGARHQQNVSFTVSSEPKATKPKPGIITILDENDKPVAAEITLEHVLTGKRSQKRKPQKAVVYKAKGTVKAMKIVKLDDDSEVLAEVDQSIDADIKNLLPVSHEALKERKKEAKDYLEEQEKMNLKAVKNNVDEETVEEESYSSPVNFES